MLADRIQVLLNLPADRAELVATDLSDAATLLDLGRRCGGPQAPIDFKAAGERKFRQVYRDLSRTR